jgi:prepilin-type N-terminal cleavage/methylation domain-containing protein
MQRVTEASRGVTLVELLVVLMILSIILTAAVKAWDVTLERGRFESTTRKLNQLSTVIVGDPDYTVSGQRVDFGYVGDMGERPRALRDLVEDPYSGLPDSIRGWRGPYIRATFNESPEGYRFDGWGDTIVYDRESLYVRSYAGYGLSDRTQWITRYIGHDKDELEKNTVDGQILDVYGSSVPNELLGRFQVLLHHPRLGQLRWDYVPVLQGGTFTFSDIAQGIHDLKVIYTHDVPPPVWKDSVLKRVTVHPGVGARDLRIRVNANFVHEVAELEGGP